LILTGGVTRQEALDELSQAPYSEELMAEDREYIAKKLGISAQEFDALIDGENKTFEDYRNSYWMIKLGTVVLRKLRIENKKFR
jgi:hypothetical protein